MKPNDAHFKTEKPVHHWAIWISDIHLGTSGCKAEYLLDFLKWNKSDTLYLVGDIIDGWQLKKGLVLEALVRMRGNEPFARHASTVARNATP